VREHPLGVYLKLFGLCRINSAAMKPMKNMATPTVCRVGHSVSDISLLFSQVKNPTLVSKNHTHLFRQTKPFRKNPIFTCLFSGMLIASILYSEDEKGGAA
jgi:hypothetical protein